MKFKRKLQVSLIIFILLSVCFISVFEPSFLFPVQAQSSGSNGSGIQLVQGPDQPYFQASNLTGYSEQAVADYNAYFKSNSGTSNCTLYQNNGYTVGIDISTSQLHYCANSSYSYAIIGMATTMNPLSTSLSVSGTTATYAGAWANTDLQFQAFGDELKETLINSGVYASESPSLTAYLEYAENVYYNNSMTIYANGVGYYQTSQTFTTQGKVAFNGPSNVTEFYFPTPTVYDSAGNTVTGTWHVSTSNGILVVNLLVPIGFINSASFPIYIDPSISRVQGNCRATTTSTTLTVTMGSTGSDLTQGDLEVLCFGSWNTTAITISSISQTNVNWATNGAGLQIQQTNLDTNYYYAAIYVGIIGSGATATVTLSLSGSNGIFEDIADICEYSGLAPNNFLDETAVSNDASGACVTGTTATTTQANELDIGAIMTAGYTLATPTYGNLLDGASLGYLEYITSSTWAATNGVATNTYGAYAGCIATFFAAGPTFSSGYQYVGNPNCRVDSITDVGTHRNFTAQQQAPIANNPYNDTLTEANTVSNTTSSFGNTATTDSSYTTESSLHIIGMNYTTPANAYKLYNVTARVKYSASTMNMECILVNYTTSAVIATTSNVSVTTTKGWFTASFASPPVVNASSIYLLMVVSSGTSLWTYYSSTTTGYQYAGSLSSWTATSVTSLTHTNDTNYEIYANCSIGIPNYQLGLEEQFTSVPSGYTFQQLDVSTCTWTTTDTIGLQAWTGSAWTTIENPLTVNSWNNYTSIGTYILSGTLTIKFIQETQASSTTQDTWAKDCCVLYLYNSTGAFTGTVTSVFSNIAGSAPEQQVLSRTGTSTFSNLANLLSRQSILTRSSTSLLSNLLSLLAEQQVLNRVSSSLLGNLIASLSRLFTGSRTLTSEINNLLSSVSSQTTNSRSTTSLLGSLSNTLSRSFVGSRTTSSLLNNLISSNSRQTVTNRVSTSLLNNMFQLLTEQQILSRSSTSLLGNLINSVSEQQILNRIQTSLLANLINSLTRLFTGSRTTTQTINNLSTSTSSQTTNSRLSTSLLSNILPSITRTAVYSRSVEISIFSNTFVNSITITLFPPWQPTSQSTSGGQTSGQTLPTPTSTPYIPSITITTPQGRVNIILLVVYIAIGLMIALLISTVTTRNQKKKKKRKFQQGSPYKSPLVKYT